jgi:transcriptional regulator with XRE-family HTH domain
VRELAMLAQVSTGTISKLERGEALLPRTGQAIRRALEAKGIELFDPPPGARFREPSIGQHGRYRLATPTAHGMAMRAEHG